MRSRRAMLAALAAAAMLAGCATPRPPAEPGVERIAGRLAVQVAATPGTEARSVSGAFELRGNARAGELDLVSPLGTTLARARWEPGIVSLVTSQGERHFDTLAAMSLEALGEAIPVEALFDWLRARPWPGAPSVANDGGFEQLGWAVDLAGAADGAITARRAAPPAVTVRARLERP